MDNKDYYELLGVSADAQVDTIKAAYRRAARKYHPDVNPAPWAEEHFKAINEAYETLSNPLKRERFDRTRHVHTDDNPSRTRSNPVHGTHAAMGNPLNSMAVTNGGRLSHLLDKLFGKSPALVKTKPVSKAKKSIPQIVSVRLSLEDVYSGATKTIRLPTGETLQVKIPQGIEEGKQIHLTRKGLQPSDLYLKIQLLEHALFTLKSSDLHLTLPITPWEAALGTSLQIPSLGGTLQLTVPSNTSSGQKLRLKGKGMPSATLTGDLIVTIQIVTPPANTQQDQQFYQNMAQQFNWSPRATWS